MAAGRRVIYMWRLIPRTRLCVNFRAIYLYAQTVYQSRSAAPAAAEVCGTRTTIHNGYENRPSFAKFLWCIRAFLIQRKHFTARRDRLLVCTLDIIFTYLLTYLFTTKVRSHKGYLASLTER